MTDSKVRRRILLVDDDVLIATATQRLISKHHEIIHMKSGKDALELLRKDNNFDVIICDLIMPEINGIDLFNLIEKAHPHLTNRFLFMTGGACTPQTIEFMDRTNQPKLDKPFESKELLRAIDNLMESLE